MLKKLFAILFIFTTLSAVAQENHDERLLERYTSAELTRMQNENPKEYTTLVKALETGITIGEYLPQDEAPAEKRIPFDGVIEADLSKENTYISLGIELKEVYQYFKIKGTNKVVTVRPKESIYKYL